MFGKPGWKQPLGRHKHICEDNIKIDMKVKMWKNVDWIYLTQDRDQLRVLVNAIINIWERLRAFWLFKKGSAP
jgi:hypothetical protein